MTAPTLDDIPKLVAVTEAHGPDAAALGGWVLQMQAANSVALAAKVLGYL